MTTDIGYEFKHNIDLAGGHSLLRCRVENFDGSVPDSAYNYDGELIFRAMHDMRRLEFFDGELSEWIKVPRLDYNETTEATWTFGGLNPRSDPASLGNTSQRWDLYAHTIDADVSATFLSDPGTATSNLQISGHWIQPGESYVGVGLTVNRNDYPAEYGYLVVSSKYVLFFADKLLCPHLIPSEDNNLDVGDPAIRWRNGYFSTGLYVGGTAVSLAGHTHDASAITTGTIDRARLGSGASSSSLFLAGDSSWKAVDYTWLTNVPSSFAPSAHSATLITSGTIDRARLGSGSSNGNMFLAGDSSWKFVSYNWLTDVPSSFTPASHTLGSHSDCTLGSPSVGDVVKWNGSKYVTGGATFTSFSGNELTISGDGYAGLILNAQPSGDHATINTTGSGLVFTVEGSSNLHITQLATTIGGTTFSHISQYLGFFAASPVVKQTITNSTIVDTADSTYSSNEQTMLNGMKLLLNEIRALLVAYGLG